MDVDKNDYEDDEDDEDDEAEAENDDKKKNKNFEENEKQTEKLTDETVQKGGEMIEDTTNLSPDEEEYEEVYVNVVFPPDQVNFDSKSDPINAQPANQSKGSELQESINYSNETSAAALLNRFRVSGLENDEPLFQLRNNILLGSWSKLVGTELVFNENGEFVTTVDGHIVLQHGKMENKSFEKKPLMSRAVELARKVADNNTANLSSKEVSVKIEEDNMDVDKE